MLQKVIFVLVFVLECVLEALAAPIKLREALDDKAFATHPVSTTEQVIFLSPLV